MTPEKENRVRRGCGLRLSQGCLQGRGLLVARVQLAVPMLTTLTTSDTMLVG